MIYVLARYREHALEFCRAAQDYTMKDFSVLSRPEDLQGTRRATVILIDGWRRRSNALAFSKTLRDRKCVCLKEVSP